MIVERIDSYELTSGLSMMHESIYNQINYSCTYSATLIRYGCSEVPDIDRRIRRLTIEKINDIIARFKSKIVYEIFFFRLTRNHQCIIHQRECSHNLS